MSDFLTPGFLACVLLLSACSGTPQAESTGSEMTVAGVFHKGFEAITLQPCGSDTLWWVTGEEDFFVQTNAFAQEVAEEPIGRGGYRVFLRVRGVKSPAGEYGFLGNYQYEFRVTAVEELRALTDQDCP